MENSEGKVEGTESLDRSLCDLKGRDPWLALSSHTAARIGLGRGGGSLRTESLLDLRLAHAGARDAVHAQFDLASMEKAFREHGIETERLATEASSRTKYLARPDIGRVLTPASAARLRNAASSWGQRDLAILVSDGLSATAARKNVIE